MLLWLMLCFKSEVSFVFSFFFEAIVGESRLEEGFELFRGWADCFLAKAPEVVCIRWEVFRLWDLFESNWFRAE